MNKLVIIGASGHGKVIAHDGDVFKILLWMTMKVFLNAQDFLLLERLAKQQR